MSERVLCLRAIILVAIVVTPARGFGDDSIDFNRNIRPILSAHCYACHGPDDAQRKAKLRLDTREGLLDQIVVGKPDESYLIERVASSDPSYVMPPPKFKKQLQADQVATLRRWIKEGAKYADHWSFVAPEKPTPPEIPDHDEAIEPADRFIRARLHKQGIKPSPPADPVSLLRRASLDLIGLPPTPADAESFRSDPSPDAYERAVDRLLASPRYGEHMSRYWLDAARYGDTHGLHLDNYREMWPYRRWVIDAFNAGKTYEEFLTEQLAGDLLPNATLDQQVATGFLRAHVTTNEGGSIAEEVYVRNVVDRVDTNGTVLLGLSVGCARCHDHKYDPVTQKEYYQLFAFFNNLDGRPLDGNKKDPAPVARVPTEEQQWRLAQLEQQIQEAERVVAAQSTNDPMPTLPTGPTSAKFVRIELIGKDVYLSLAEVQAFVGDENVARSGKATQHSVAYGGPPELAIDGNTDGNYSGARSTTHTDQATDPWWEVDLGSPHQLDRVTVWNRTDAVVERLQPFRVVLLDAERNPLWVRTIKEAPRPRVELSIPADAEKLTDADQKELLAYRKNSRPSTPEERRLESLKKQRGELDKQIPTTLVFKEQAKPREAFVLHRGEYEQRREKVERQLPAFLPPLPTDAPNDRLGFARWVTDRANPLTARVAVNRFWQQVFGEGLVKTADDFGAQGSPPSHPELLDWLAIRFIDDDWDVKRLMRRLVTTATYRQSARVTPESLAKDPSNRFLGRGPRHRLDAEALRDQALFVSGLLVERLGGPSVKPPQPDGLWKAVGYSGSNTVRFVADTDPEKIHRRSLYTFWKRTSPPPQMSAFDAPTREACTVRRERTNTPLQALLLMNDPQYVAAARSLAERTMREVDSEAESRARYMFRLAVVREPEADEVAELLGAFESVLADYRADPAAAARLVGKNGEDVPERAAWTMIASVVLNLDEVINK